MSQSRKKIAGRLSSAQQDKSPVTVFRKHLNYDETPGFVVAISDEWVVLQDLLEGVYLDSLVFLRLDFVTKVETRWNKGYVQRAVAEIGEPLKTFHCQPDVSIGDLLRLIDQRAELVLIYLENRKDYRLSLGKVRALGNKRVDVQYVRGNGTWCGFVDAWKLKDITRIEIGGRYIEALERFSDPVPEVRKRKKR